VCEYQAASPGALLRTRPKKLCAPLISSSKCPTKGNSNHHNGNTILGNHNQIMKSISVIFS